MGGLFLLLILLILLILPVYSNTNIIVSTSNNITSIIDRMKERAAIRKANSYRAQILPKYAVTNITKRKLP